MTPDEYLRLNRYSLPEHAVEQIEALVEEVEELTEEVEYAAEAAEAAAATRREIDALIKGYDPRDPKAMAATLAHIGRVLKDGPAAEQ